VTNVLPSGFEHTVGVCHLGVFLPTLRLLPRLLAARGRVVMVSSESAATPGSRGSRSGW
jgi:NAD(P)-dependent dehydrogenase (short-subunit alcohol dehydrogenase family)